LNPVFSIIAQLKRVTDEKETRTSEIKFKNSDLVEAGRRKSNFIFGLKLIEEYLKAI
jgi:hypothetical protein